MMTRLMVELLKIWYPKEEEANEEHQTLMMKMMSIPRWEAVALLLMVAVCQQWEAAGRVTAPTVAKHSSLTSCR